MKVFIVLLVIVVGTQVSSYAWDCTPPGGYYNGTQGLSGEALLLALRDIIDDHTALGYVYARDVMYGEIDCINGNTICCVYTGRCGSNNACSRSGAGANNFNCEHTWPQAFFNEEEPMRSDIFNLFPTDVDANSTRANYPFGAVTGAPSWSVGGSKLGSDGMRTVFEPRDAHKGDAARSILYMIVRYGFDLLEQGAQDYFDDRQLNVLLDWNHFDPPDEWECNRNNGIFGYQHNRNPFIDNTVFADLIWRPDTVTITPTVFVTATETPTVTVTPTPSPYLSPTISPTPTITFTPPPTSTTTLTPTPTNPPSATFTPTEPWVTLWMPDHFFTPGSQCGLQAQTHNPGAAMESVVFTVFLNIGTEDYWFYPGWIHYPPEVSFITVPLEQGVTTYPIIDSFQWPEGAGSLDSLSFTGILVYPDFSGVLGLTGSWNFGYGL